MTVNLDEMFSSCSGRNTNIQNIWTKFGCWLSFQLQLLKIRANWLSFDWVMKGTRVMPFYWNTV